VFIPPRQAVAIVTALIIAEPDRPRKARKRGRAVRWATSP